MEEEKENAEQRAEDTESREGRGSLGSLHRCKSVSSLNLLASSSAAGSCPPLPKPRRRRHRPAQEGDQLGIMVCVCLLPAHPSPRTWVFFILFVFCFFSFYLEENRVHLLHSEVYTFLNCLVFNHSTMAQQRIRLDIWTTGLAHHHDSARACLCVVGPGLCWAQQLQGSFCSQGADSFVKVTIGSPHGVGKPCSTFSIAAAWLRGAGHAVGTKPRIYTGLLADGPGHGLRPALHVKPG